MEWRECPSFPGYDVSRCGTIRGPGGILSPRILNGYEMVGLYNGPYGVPRKRAFCRVHRLVAEAFLDDWNGGVLSVDHIDRNRRNNRVENLRMATTTQQQANRDTSNNSKGNRRKVERICPETGVILEIHASMTDGAEYVGGDIGNIWSCIVGKTTTSHGYVWRYHILHTDIDGEVWKQYGHTRTFVSDLGRFKRRTSTGFSSIKDSSEFSKTSGYPVIGINKKNMLCHRVVAEMFLGDPPGDSGEKFVVNHIDGNKDNASVANLEWLTESENGMHAHDMGLSAGRKRIVRICPKTGSSIEYDGVCVASRSTGISRTAIGNCLNGVSKSAGGYVWHVTT
jgi:hypothetical protein